MTPPGDEPAGGRSARGQRWDRFATRLRRRPDLVVLLVASGEASFLEESLGSVLASDAVTEVLLVAHPGDRAAQVAVRSAASRHPAACRAVPADGDSWLDDAVSTARGRYLAFLDADDVVPPGTHARLVAGLASSGSDVAVGPQRTVRGSENRLDSWHDVVFAKPRTGVSLESFPAALADLSLTNKVFRLGFWRRAGLSLASWTGADPTVAEAYLRAAGFDVQPDAVHERRVRDIARPVSEQARFRASTAQVRGTALVQVADCLDRRRPELLDGWLTSVLEHGLPPMYLDAVGGGEGYHRSLTAAVQDLWSRTSGAARARVRVHLRCSAWVAAHGSLADLASVQDLLADNPHGLPTVLADDTGLLVAVPSASGRAAPPEVRRVQTVDRRLRARVDSATRRPDGRLVIEGAAFVEYQQVHDLPVVTLLVAGQRHPLRVVARRDPDLNLWAARAHEDHADAGFTASLDVSGPVAEPEAPRRVEVQLGGSVRTLACPVETEASGAPHGAPGRPDGLDLVGLDLVGDSVFLTGTGAGAHAVRLRGPRGTTGSLAVTARTDGFVVEVPLRTRLFGDPVLLPADRYAVEVLDIDGQVLAARWAPALHRPPAERVGEGVRVATRQAVGGGAVLLLGAPLRPATRSAFGQQCLRTLGTAPAGRDGGLDRSTVLLEAFRGSSVGDNPGAIARELLARDRSQDLGLDLAFVVDDPSVAAPTGTRAVVRRSPQWYEALARAGAYVSNAGAPSWFRKRPGQLHLQTWHGTPVKRIGEDRGPGDFQTWRHRRHLAAQAAGWDAMVSASPGCSEIFRSAFGFSGSFLETGYPRNDVLLSTRATARRAQVREKLRLLETDRVVLYAPTWREYVGVREAKPVHLDVHQLTQALPDAVVLLRGHYTGIGQPDLFSGDPRVHDVTRYPDIADLYLAADVLVTDYSSVMFDFVLTDKPVVLLVPDLEQYRDVERGFYFDLEQWAPGPLVATTAEVVAVLMGPDRHAPARKAFRHEFCPFEDGAASQRVVEYCLAFLASS